MSTMQVMDNLAEQGVVAIVRTKHPTDATSAARVLFGSGLHAVEISLVTPRALDVIAEFAEPGPKSVGAGTVRTLKDAREAHAAGAAFLVSPLLDLEVVRYAVEHDLAVFPGCLTPTEMATAASAGASALKIFPAQVWSPAALRGMLEAMPELKCVPTGGVGPETAAQWIEAGAFAVGVGGSLTRAADPHSAVTGLLASIRGARG